MDPQVGPLVRPLVRPLLWEELAAYPKLPLVLGAYLLKLRLRERRGAGAGIAGRAGVAAVQVLAGAGDEGMGVRVVGKEQGPRVQVRVSASAGVVAMATTAVP